MTHTFSDHPQIHLVSSFDKLINTAFQGDTNAMCWHRNLAGDFKEIVTKLELKENITEVSEQDLSALALTEQGELAREIILKDIKQLTALGASPCLNLIRYYERDEELDFISTDVYSFHVDRSPIETDTFLCTYHGASSDILPNADALQKIHIPEIREKLKAFHDATAADFETFLKDYFFDLHYQPKDNAVPINLGLGHLWRLAVDHPTQQVLPCVHRAPVESDGEYRLLLIC
ncbi:MAG: hypothetical protein GAK29_02450 [Acinetobacter bereziniae]|uniref:DUF1826 domain-containing protein n=1 Tax=Acinetobacter bereziniae TaxID=106648 RepID=A0A833UNK4_ACIBZ|nr:MAG: hypothetical protein GAK29_02450 [Acinetobacter bereziniae]